MKATITDELQFSMEQDSISKKSAKLLNYNQRTLDNKYDKQLSSALLNSDLNSLQDQSINNLTSNKNNASSDQISNNVPQFNNSISTANLDYSEEIDEYDK